MDYVFEVKEMYDLKVSTIHMQPNLRFLGDKTYNNCIWNLVSNLHCS